MAFDPVTYGAAKKYTDEAIASAGSEHYLGITSTELTDGASTNPITINGSPVTAVAGDYCIYSSKEFLFNGSVWQEYGDISAVTYAMLQDKPSINSNTLSGNKTSSDLGLAGIQITTTDPGEGSVLATGTLLVVLSEDE